MNASNRVIINILKCFAKELVGSDVIIKKEDGFFYDYRRNYISILTSMEYFKNDEEEINDFFEKDLGIKDLHNITVAFLHELGHFWSHRAYKLNEDFYNDNGEQRELISTLFEFGAYNYGEAIRRYYELPCEKLANQFLVLVYENERTREIITDYNNKIERIFQKLNAE